MKHPLVEKYRKASLQGLEPAELIAARDEIRAAIEAKGKTKLSPEDRVVLMQLWIATFDKASMAAAKILEKKEPTAEAAPRKKSWRIPVPKFKQLREVLKTFRILKTADFAFLVLLMTVSAVVIALGTHAMQETIRIEAVKREAESLEELLRSNGPKRQASDFQPSSCQKQSAGPIRDCIIAMSEGRKNHFNPGQPLIASKCDMSQANSLGSIIFERVITTNTGTLVSSPLQESDEISREFMLRILVCARGFHAIRVANDFTF